MTGEVIKSFLVGLGFGVDDASLAKFNKAITSATLKVTALYVSTKVAAAGILAGISKVSEGFEEMGYEYRLIAPSINRVLVLRRELLKAYSLAGINVLKTVQASVKLNMSLTKTKFAFQAIYRSVASRFFGLITKQSDLFRQRIYANMPKIQNILEHLVKFIFKSLEATTALGTRLWSILTRVYDFFVLLDNKTQGWSTVILAVIAAWKLLNLSFIATPLGMLLTGFTALLALWDDFKTFKEGGQSLINWGSEMTKTMVGLAAAIGAVALALKAWSVLSAVVTLVQSLNKAVSIMDALLLITEAPIWAIVAAIGAVTAALTLADNKWKIFGGNLSGFFSGVGGKILDYLGNVAVPNLSALPASPLGAGHVSNSNSQHVNQQTSINVMGSADANAVGKAVSGEQSKVNFDMIRNLKGATR